MRVAEGISTGVDFFFNSSKAIQNSNNLSNSLFSLEGVIKKVGIAAGTYLTFRGIKSAVGGVISTGQTAENQLTKLEVVIGNADEAFKIYQKSVDIANRTPFETTQVVDAVVQLRSVGVNAFQQLGNSGKDTFTAISDMAGATGYSMAEASMAVIGGITGEMESLKKFGILAKRLPPAMQKMEYGTIAWEKALLNYIATQKRFNKGTEKMSKTLTGILSTIRGVWGEFVKHISGVGDAMFRGTKMSTFYDEVKKTAEEFLVWWMKNLDVITNFARAIGQGLRVVWAVAKGIFGLMGKAINILIKKFKKWWAEFGEGDDALRVFVTKITAVTIAIEIFFEEMWNTISKHKDLIISAFYAMAGVITLKLIPVLASLGNAFAYILSKGGILLALTAGVDLLRNWNDLDSAAKKLRVKLMALGAALYLAKFINFNKILNFSWAILKGLGITLLKGLLPALKFLGFTLFRTVIPAIWAFTVALLANPITWIVLAIAGLVAGIVLLVKYWPEIKAFGGKLITWFKDAAVGFGTWVSDLWNKIINGVREMVYDTINFFIQQYNKLADLIGIGQLKLLEVTPKAAPGAAPATASAVSPESAKVLTTPAKTTTITHHSSATITVNESGNPRETAAQVVNLMDRRFAAGGAY